MKDWRKSLILPDYPIMSAIQKIDTSTMQIALVVDENNCLLGTITDGDIRRGILKGITLNEPVRLVMNENPIVGKLVESRESILAKMRNKRLRHIPIVDSNGIVVGLEFLDELLQPSYRENWVVLMAGGLGNRLRPLTNDCPKPLLKVGGKPLLETILENFREYGFKKFYVSVNYKAEMIMDYFGDGANWNIEIRYIHEEKKLGTSGALGLLPEKPKQSLLIMNGDLLTKINFQRLLDFHLEHKATATMCVREYDFQVPYGVVKINNHDIVSIEEKPIYNFFISAGIYVLEPVILELIKKDEYLDMPTLFNNLIKQHKKTVVFPIREYWLDIGLKEDFERANKEFRILSDK